MYVCRTLWHVCKDYWKSRMWTELCGRKGYVSNGLRVEDRLVSETKLTVSREYSSTYDAVARRPEVLLVPPFFYLLYPGYVHVHACPRFSNWSAFYGQDNVFEKMKKKRQKFSLLEKKLHINTRGVVTCVHLKSIMMSFWKFYHEHLKCPLWSSRGKIQIEFFIKMGSTLLDKIFEFHGKAPLMTNFLT